MTAIAKRSSAQPRFELTEAEVRTAVWTKIEAHIRERLASHRRKNDSDLDEPRTAKLRGRIAEAKYLLSLNPANEVLGAEDTAG